MRRLPIAGKLRAAFLVIAVALPPLSLAGCIGEWDVTGGTGVDRRLDSTTVRVDAGAAAAMISGYRADNGLGPVRVNASLGALAEKQARAMASADRMTHTVGGPFRSRLNASGYRARVAAENIGAGYRNLPDALAAWRGSATHRRNLLLREATEFGIGTAHAPGSKYSVYWSLILAAPAD